jgi:hypothetical protein
MRKTSSVVIAALMSFFASSTQAKEADRWLPLKRSELLALLTQGDASFPFKVTTLDDANSLKTEPSARLLEDDVWSISDETTPMSVTVASRGEDVHSIRVWIAPVNFRSDEQGNRIFALIVAIFTRIYPNWPEAAEWPAKSFAESWSLWEPVITDPKRDRNEFLVRATINGITSATFGVPPDWAIFTATTRPQCVPDMRDPGLLRRVIC